MNSYFLRKILGSIVMLFGLMTLLFFLLRLAPGGPFDGDKNFPEEVMRNIQAMYGLDLPVWRQYLKWVGHAVRGDFGESFATLGRPVSELIAEAAGPSLLLGSLAFGAAFVLGIASGVWSARFATGRGRAARAIDQVFFYLAQGGLSVPSYLIASLLVVVVSLRWELLPPALWDGPETWVLPVVTLAIRPIALVYSLTRAELLEQIGNDYVRTAFAKGLGARAVFFRHALRNSLIPVVTYSGPILANLITGSFLVELVFQIPGLGKYFVSAILNRDYPVVLGVTLTYGVILVSSNLLSDFVCGMIDPRIREAESAAGVRA